MAEQNQGEMPENQGEMPEQELTFDGWIATQDDAVKGLLTSHTSGLKKALDQERDERARLQKELKSITGELEKGTEARTKLEGITAKLDEYESQLAVYETLTAAGVTNLKLGWMAAQSSGAIDKRGNVNLETLKAEFPELFKKTTTPPPPGNAGTGQNNGLPAGKVDMDALIRQRAGIGPR